MITELYNLKTITPSILCLEMSSNDGWIGLLGALIGGVVSLIATNVTHRYNLKQAEKERIHTEISTILSLSEELKVLMACYSDEFQNYFNQLSFNKSVINQRNEHEYNYTKIR